VVFVFCKSPLGVRRYLDSSFGTGISLTEYIRTELSNPISYINTYLKLTVKSNDGGFLLDVRSHYLIVITGVYIDVDDYVRSKTRRIDRRRVRILFATTIDVLVFK